MRIISGSLKGRKIIAPKKFEVRPTKDFLKEGLFNILANRYHFENLSILDLFSGTGNISYEFASRGANRITAIEQNNQHSAFIKETAKQLGFNQISVVCSDVFSFLENAMSQSYDIIFADPPYDLNEDDFEKIATLIFQKELLKTDGILVIEHSSKTNLSKISNFSHERKYGSSKISFFH